MLQFIIPIAIGCISLFLLIGSYKFIKEFSNTTLSNKALIFLLTFTTTLFTTFTILIFLDMNMINIKLFETHKEYIFITLSAINLTVFIVIPYIYFFLEGLTNVEDESKNLSSSESCIIIFLIYFSH